MRRGAKIAIGASVLAIGTVVVLAVVMDEGRTPDGKQRPDTPEGRHGFVEIMQRHMPADSMWTEGARAQGLVIDLSDCTMRVLSDFVQRRDMAESLWQFDFAYVRCTNGVRVDAPWAGHE